MTTTVAGSIMFALSVPKTITNEALHTYEQHELMRRKLSATKNCSTAYLFCGRHLCKTSFCAIIQLSQTKIKRLITEVEEVGFLIRKTRLNDSQLGKVSMQTALCITFLRSYGQIFALPYPTGIGPSVDEPNRYIDINVSRKDLYNTYGQEWESLLNYMLNTD